MDGAAVAALHDERLDWRFKAIPSAAFGLTIGEFLQQRPSLWGSGFVGPLLVLDEAALEHNLRTMADWCARSGVRLAPHGKTSMAPQLFQRQLRHGAWGMTAANISQLRVYRAFGVSRILLANQLVDANALRWVAAELRRDPELSLACWVDSVHGVRLMSQALSAAGVTRPLDVLVELGGSDGRTGVRTAPGAIEVARAVSESPALRLIGVAGYEAALVRGVRGQDLSTVDHFLHQLRELVVELTSLGHFDGLDQVIVSCGGSSYFDQVADALTAPWPAGLPVVPVLRSGCYLTHDDGLYRDLSPLGRQHRLAGQESPFRPAMRIWAQVTSRPEPELALVTMGRRDVSFDAGLPEPQVSRRAADPTEQALRGCRVTALADQHAFLAIPAESGLEVGDWVGFGVSHPCTVFDRWPLIPAVKDGYVVDLVRTFF